LVDHDRCWIADRLARRGLPHPDRCPHCDQAEESINHLLLSCVFAREFWFKLLQRVGLQFLAPLIDEVFFDDWWKRIIVNVGTSYRKASTPLSSLGLGPCGFIVISVCLMEFLQTWLKPYCSPGRSYFFGFWLRLEIYPTYSPLCRCSVFVLVGSFLSLSQVIRIVSSMVQTVLLQFQVIEGRRRWC